MKRYICLIISLCLILGLFLPVYAATIEDYNSQFTSPSAINYDQYHIKEDHLGNYQETRADAVSDAGTHTLLNDLIRVFTGSGGTMYNSVSEFMSWITPVGSFSTSHSITEVTLYEIVDYIAWTLSGTGPTVYDTFQSIASMVTYLPSIDSKMSTNNTYLDDLKKALTNYRAGDTSVWSSFAQIYAQAHRNLFKIQSGTNAISSAYEFRKIGSSGSYTDPTYYWTYGTPLGNIANMLQKYNLNFVDSYVNRWSADLTHYNDNLTTWDSQGDTLTQVAFTPDSAIQGLYRYLAFTQRDVARLTYVFANDKELEARELAQDNQEEVVDEFIDPNGQSSVSTNDIGSISDLSSGYQQNFGSTASVTGIFDIFDSNHFGWFSSETYNQLDTTTAQRGSSFETPLLDQQLKDISRALGVDYAN